MSGAGIFVRQRDIVVGILDWKGSWPFEDNVAVTQSFRSLAKYFLVSIVTLLRQQEEIATSQQALKALTAA